MELVDVPSNGKKFTQCSSDGISMRMLDRFLLSDDIKQLECHDTISGLNHLDLIIVGWGMRIFINLS